MYSEAKADSELLESFLIVHSELKLLIVGAQLGLEDKRRSQLHCFVLEIGRNLLVYFPIDIFDFSSFLRGEELGG